ncbi:hypothetical protein [Xanthomonas arboricola]|uniref:hypothetical protein n=1 Tax=Xanthomonas arboricola TaxID=56448 RepID=UPI0035E4C040
MRQVWHMAASVSCVRASIPASLRGHLACRAASMCVEIAAPHVPHAKAGSARRAGKQSLLLA